VQQKLLPFKIINGHKALWLWDSIQKVVLIPVKIKYEAVGKNLTYSH
jgi:hypothetical protein